MTNTETAETRRARLIVRYVDGNENVFTFDQPVKEGAMMARVQEALESQHLVIELEDRVRIIPVHQIKSVEIQPKPAKLPALTVRHARLIK